MKTPTKTKFTTVSIPITLNDKIKEFIKPTGFTSVASFVTYLLRQVLSDSKSKPYFTNAEEEKIKDRLRSLGYM